MLYTQIRAFDAVAREGSFVRAAEMLGVTQPALTIQVKALEEAYGVKLLHRTGRSVRLTAAGERLFRMSRRFASVEEEIRHELSASEELKNVHLRVAVDGPHIAMGLFARFLAHHPGVSLSVATGNSRFVKQALLERRTDVAILPAIKRHPQIHAVPLWHHVGVLIVARNHPWANRKSVDLQDLDGQPMIAREDGSNTQKAAHDALTKIGAQPKVVLELGSREGVCEAVAAGLGTAIIWELEAYGSRRFTAIPIRGDAIRSTDYVACLKSERLRRSVKAFFAIADTLPGNKVDVAALRAG